jgi:hypothetical protein
MDKDGRKKFVSEHLHGISEYEENEKEACVTFCLTGKTPKFRLTGHEQSLLSYILGDCITYEVEPILSKEGSLGLKVTISSAYRIRRVYEPD